MTAGVCNAVYEFIPLERSHLRLIDHWLRQPHVGRWWGSAEGALKNIADHLDEPGFEPFLVRLEEAPIGYLQVYDPFAEADHPYRDQPAGTRGIDQFIGEGAFVGRGHGTRMTRQIVAALHTRGSPRVVADPAPANGAAIRAYMNAGFFRLGPRETAYGPVLLLACDRVR